MSDWSLIVASCLILDTEAISDTLEKEPEEEQVFEHEAKIESTDEGQNDEKLDEAIEEQVEIHTEPISEDEEIKAILKNDVKDGFVSIHKIERVDTEDTTSIDTNVTLQPDEPLSQDEEIKSILNNNNNDVKDVKAGQDDKVYDTISVDTNDTLHPDDPGDQAKEPVQVEVILDPSRVSQISKLANQQQQSSPTSPGAEERFIA